MYILAGEAIIDGNPELESSEGPFWSRLADLTWTSTKRVVMGAFDFLDNNLGTGGIFASIWNVVTDVIDAVTDLACSLLSFLC